MENQIEVPGFISRKIRAQEEEADPLEKSLLHESALLYPVYLATFFGAAFLISFACFKYYMVFQSPVYIVPAVHVPARIAKEAVHFFDPGEQFNYLIQNEKVRSHIQTIKCTNNNPGNLHYAGQPGAKNSNGFAVFDNIVNGYRSLYLQIALDQSRKLTLEQFLNKYSPPYENDTERLISVASKILNLGRKATIDRADTFLLTQAIANQEFGIDIINP